MGFKLKLNGIKEERKPYDESKKRKEGGMKQRHIYHIAWISFCWIICLFPGALNAEEASFGKIIASKGAVLAIDPKGYERGLKAESPLFRNDTIRTGKRARLQILCLDNTIISLGEESELVVSEYQWEPGKQSGAMTAKINEGLFRVMGGAITKASPENFKTLALSATIGIRGSMFSGKLKGDSLSVLFEGGKGIVVTNASKSVVISRAGFGTLIQSVSAPPIPPIRFSASQIQELNVNSDKGTANEEKLDTRSQEESEADPGQTAEGETTDSETCDGCDNPNENIVLRSMPGKYSAISDGALKSTGQGEADSFLFSKFIQVDYKDFIGGELSFSFDLAEIADLSATAYSGSKSWYYNKPVTFNNETFNLPMKLDYSSLHQFYMISGQEIVNAAEGPFTFTTFATTGIPAEYPALAGTIGRYEGRFISHAKNQSAATLSTLWAAANWQYKKVFGVIDFGDSGNILESAFFMGKIKENQRVDIDLFGFYPGDVQESESLSLISGAGTGNTGQFYGTSQHGFDFNANGAAHLLNGTDARDLSITGGAFMDPEIRTQSMSGAETIEGFAVGVTRLPDDASNSKRIMMNDSSDEMRLIIDKDQGTLSASMSLKNDDGALLKATFGGEADSCFVDDTAYIARTQTNAASSGVLVTARAEDQFSETDVAWGYWGVYENGGDHGCWVAGKRTTQDQISTRLAGGTTLEFKGAAYGLEIASTGSESSLGSGISTIALDFAAHTASGKIDFKSVDIHFSATDLTASGAFKGAATNMDSGSVTGALFGQGAGMVAGGFDATKDGTQYTGVYGAALK